MRVNGYGNKVTIATLSGVIEPSVFFTRRRRRSYTNTRNKIANMFDKLTHCSLTNLDRRPCLAPAFGTYKKNTKSELTFAKFPV